MEKQRSGAFASLDLGVAGAVVMGLSATRGYDSDVISTANLDIKKSAEEELGALSGKSLGELMAA
jgi:hypothetical protein